MTALQLPEPAALYVRVSTAEQFEAGYSVQEQTEKLKAYCLAMGWNDYKIYTDPGYSGASLDRPGIQEVIRDVGRGACRKVIVWKLDRLSRSQKDTLVLLEDVFAPAGCAFVSLCENFDTATPIGRCIVGVLAAFAQMERENIKMRTQMGRSASIRAGKYAGPCAPVGYMARFDRSGKREIVPDPYESIIIKDMYRLYNSGRSLGEIARHCIEKYDAFKDLKTSPATRIQRILKNPVYAGLVKDGGRLFPGKHEALVSMEEWEAANARISDNVQAFERKGRRGLLSGMIFCGCCGARMCAQQYGSKGKRYLAYTCYSVSKIHPNMVKDPNCQNRKNKPKVDELDQLILDEISKLAADPAAFDSLKKDPEGGRERGEALRGRLAEIEKQIARLLNLYQTGVMDLEELQPRLSDLKEERGKISRSLEEEAAAEDNKLPKEAALDIANAFPAAVAAGDPDQLRALVRALIEKVEIINGEVSIYWKFN